MGSEENLPEAGWYEDPDGQPGRRRYWDGTQWTSRYSASTAPTRVTEIDRSFRSLFTIARVLHALGWITIVLGGLAVIVGTIGAASSDTVTLNSGGTLQHEDGAASAVVIAVVGTIAVAFYALALFGAAALIRLTLRVEDSTFRTAAAVERLLERNAQ
jgi:hypothetical protein